MFKNLGKLKYEAIESFDKILLTNLTEGINNHENYIILKNRGKIIVYNRVCDHAGGKS